MRDRLYTIGRYAIVAGCLYEAVAIPHKTPLPTITKMVKWSQRYTLGKLATLVWLCLWAHHFVDPDHLKL